MFFLKRIAFLAESSLLASDFAREALRGVREYINGSRSLLLRGYFGPSEWERPLKEHDPQGLLAIVSRPEMHSVLARCRCPIVCVGFPAGDASLPRVDIDHHAVGRMAAEFFLSRGLKNFGFISDVGTPPQLRLEAFVERLKEHGHQCHIYSFDRGYSLADRPYDAIGEWLKSLPKPVGLAGCTDFQTVHTLNQITAMGFSVPSEIAVLNCDDGELACELSQPTISGISTPLRRIGFEAASLLDRLMQGEPTPLRPVLIAPAIVEERETTLGPFINDRVLTSALQYINDHAAEPISVKDILREVSVSRRALEIKFAKILRTTPALLIRRQRIQRAKSLLASTQLPIADVARRAGYLNASRLSISFRAETGMTPGEFRRISGVGHTKQGE